MPIPDLGVSRDRARLHVLGDERKIALSPEVNDEHILVINLPDVDGPHELVPEELDRLAGLREIRVTFPAEEVRL
jgi:hypothetical protein